MMWLGDRRWKRRLVGLLLWTGIGVFTERAFADQVTCIDAANAEVDLRKAGRLKEAMKKLSVCADPGCPGMIQADCNQRFTEVQARMPTIVLSATDALGNDLTTVRVTMDELVLTSSLDGHAIEVDPGTHTLRFEADGKKPSERAVVVVEGEKNRKVALVLDDARSSTPLVPVPEPSLRPLTNDIRHPSVHPWRTTGMVLGSAGVASILVGGVLGGLAITDSGAAKNDCIRAGGSPGACPLSVSGAATNEMQSARTLAAASTGLIIGGVALVTAGVTLVFLRGKPKEASTLALGSILARGMLATYTF